MTVHIHHPGHVTHPVALPISFPEDWMEHAVCPETDPEAFFPEKGHNTAAAKQVCIGCPVKAECLEYALEHNIRFGVWGGTSERDRRLLTAGKPVPVSLSFYDERAAKVKRLTAAGWTTADIAKELGIDKRSVVRARGRVIDHKEAS